MEIYFFIIPIGLILIAVAIRFLFWAIHSGQYDNLETEANRILFDEDTPVDEKPTVDSTTATEEQTPVSMSPGESESPR